MENLSWFGATRAELDLRNRDRVFEFIQKESPDAVVIAAAKVGGIHANSTEPVAFLSENLQIQTNLLDGAASANVERLVFLGSSCIYPRLSQQPIKESYLLTGALEPTNEPYSIAKIAGLKLTEAYRNHFGLNWASLMPTNIYGPNDNFHPENSHVIPGLIRKFHEAKVNHLESVTLWGSGEPLREFVFVDDLANAIITVLSSGQPASLTNVGSGDELSVADLASKVASVVGFHGSVSWDRSKPDGTPRKLLDSTSIREMGWRPQVTLDKGLEITYRWFKETEILDKVRS